MKTRLAALLIVTLTPLTMGCAATHTAIAKHRLHVQTHMSHAIFLSPPTADEPQVYMSVRNTTGDPALDVAQGVQAALEARGFRLTRHAAQAAYTLQAQVLYKERTTPERLAQAHYGGFGDAVGTAVAGAAIGSAVGGGYRGAAAGFGVGALIGGLVGTAVNAAVEDVVYVVVTDVRLGERTQGKITSQTEIESPQGSGGTMHQVYDEESRRLYHMTRITSTANQVNLKFEDAAPVLVEDLVQSLAGMF